MPCDGVSNPADPDASYNAHRGLDYMAQIVETYAKDDGPVHEEASRANEKERGKFAKSRKWHHSVQQKKRKNEREEKVGKAQNLLGLLHRCFNGVCLRRSDGLMRQTRRNSQGTMQDQGQLHGTTRRTL